MINDIRLKIAEFLGTTLVGTNYFYIDYWTFIHIFSAFLGMFLIFKVFKKMKNTSKFILLFMFVFFWEIIELSSSLVKLEKSIDIIYDLIMGMFGGWLFYYFGDRIKTFLRLH